MSHLMKTVDGHLAKGASGHLAKCCNCNDCDPPIPCVLCVTLSGLAGDFAPYNGPHVLQFWIPGLCHWCLSPTARITLWWQGTNWFVRLVVDASCYITWRQNDPPVPCDPTGVYPLWGTCDDAGCVDPDSCEDSVGATCAVSYGECTTTTPGA